MAVFTQCLKITGSRNGYVPNNNTSCQQKPDNNFKVNNPTISISSPDQGSWWCIWVSRCYTSTVSSHQPQNTEYSKHLLNDLISKLNWMHYYILRLKAYFQRFWVVKYQICKALEFWYLIVGQYQNIFPLIDCSDLEEL